jgi:hypothetical protein
MTSENRVDLERRMTFTVLSGTFVAIVAIFSLLRRKGREFRPFDLILLGLSAIRMGRLVSYDLAMEGIRAPFTETVPDPTGAGETVVPKGTGWRRAIGDLLTCPICAGTWIAAGLACGLEVAPRATRLLTAIMASIGLGEVVNALIETLEWGGQASREQAGSSAMAKAAQREK